MRRVSCSRTRKGGGGDGLVPRDAPRRVWFHRGPARLSGGQVKHAHYFEHVRRMPGFAPVITFSHAPSNELHARERRRLWRAGEDEGAERWAPGPGDLLFLAGTDWRYPAERGLEDAGNPRINLVQSLCHARAGTELHGYLSERAVRICVSREVADAIRATGRVRGPVLTIPNGIDVAPFAPVEGGSPAGHEARPRSVAVIGGKRPDLARRLSERLDGDGIEHHLQLELLERSAFLALLAESRAAVCLPHPGEGFYLPALEAMASGALVATLDCIGNRGFCHDHWNCVIAEPDPGSLLRAVRRILAMTPAERGCMNRRARDTVLRHSLELERRRFHAVLGAIDRLWRAA